MSVKNLLSGENAFYLQPNYKEITELELAFQAALPQPIYTYNTEHKVWRIAKEVLSIVVFPVALYNLLHALAGKVIVPASSSVRLAIADVFRKKIFSSLTDDWEVKRISVEVDGYIIDANILGKASTLGNGRWVLFSNGNCDLYEWKHHDVTFKKVLTGLNGNGILFNYPGVGKSSGLPNRHATAKAYRAMLNFLEDHEKGIGAKEIIGCGHSIGGGVQGDALLSHQLKQGVKYVFIKSRTFSELSSTAALLTNKIYGLLVFIFGWNMGSVESSKKLKAPEIIIQSANVSAYTDTSDCPEKIKHDGSIPAEVSLAKALLSESQPLSGNKYFLGVPEYHNQALTDCAHLVNKINEML